MRIIQSCAHHSRIPCPCNIIVRCGRQCRCCTVLTQRPYLCKRRCHLVGDHYIHRVWCGTLSRCWCKDIRTTCCGADHCRITCPCNIIVRCGRQCRCCTVLTQRPYLCKRRCHLVGDHYIHRVWCGTLSRCWCKDIRTTCCGADHCRIPCPCRSEERRVGKDC